MTVDENAAEPLVEEDECEEEEDVSNDKVFEEVAEQNEQPTRRKTSEGSQPPPSAEDLIAEKNKQTLAYKRSFFVRMVSDPKCYNPKIVRHLNLGSHRKMSEDLRRDMTLRLVPTASYQSMRCGKF